MADRVILITGSTDGIGKSTVQEQLWKLAGELTGVTGGPSVLTRR